MVVVSTLGILFLQGCQTSDIHQNFSMSDIVKKLKNDELCNKATTKNGSWDLRKLYRHHLNEAKRRGLDCGVKDKKTITASKKNQKSDIDVQTIACALMPSGHCRFLKKSNE